MARTRSKFVATGGVLSDIVEIERCKEVYLGNRQPVPFAGRTVIVVDDGIATGSTARTALRAIRNAGAGKIEDRGIL